MSEDADDAIDADEAPETNDGTYTDADPTVDDGPDDLAVDATDETTFGRDERATAESSGDVDGAPTTDVTDPFADIDASPGAGDPFEAIDVEPVDEDALWDVLAESDADGTQVGDVAFESTTGEHPPAMGPMGPAVAVEDDEAVVPKRSYCEGCEYFSAPPETACTHPGTEIRELVDVEHFRVVNCPVVERRRRIGESTED